MNKQHRVQAAAWVAKLYGRDRGPELEAGLRLWLAESASHRGAFEMANEVWSDLAGIPKSEYPIQVHFRSRWSARLGRPMLALAASLAAATALVVFWHLDDPTVSTQVGQVRELELEDGSKVTLNTDTRIEIQYDTGRRHVELTRGEALFDVARDPSRPFTVGASDQHIVALGTSFIVRRDADNLKVTLIDGKVAVASTVLSPGQRLTLQRNHKPQIDTPRIERVTAWKRRQVSLDHDTLAAAVHEMNRYSRVPIQLEGAAGRDILITGIFGAGDSEEFARAVADTYGLTLRKVEGSIVLSSSSPAPD